MLLQKEEAVEEYDHLRLILETVCHVLQCSDTFLITLQFAIVSASSLHLQVHRLNKLALSTLEVDSLKMMCTGLQLRVQVVQSLADSSKAVAICFL